MPGLVVRTEHCEHRDNAGDDADQADDDMEHREGGETHP
jgi:hypothetical protein